VAETEVGAIDDEQLGFGPIPEALGNSRHQPDRSVSRGQAARSVCS
jgi:hypothetical protein